MDRAAAGRRLNVSRMSRRPARRLGGANPASRLGKPGSRRCAMGKTTIRRGRFSPPNFIGVRQHKKRKTYAHQGCEQLVRKFALKCLFLPQLLRPLSVRVRSAKVLFHAPFVPLARPSAAPYIFRFSSGSYISAPSKPRPLDERAPILLPFEVAGSTRVMRKPAALGAM